MRGSSVGELAGTTYSTPGTAPVAASAIASSLSRRTRRLAGRSCRIGQSGSIQECPLPSAVRAIRRFTVRPVLPRRSPRSATSPATCAGPGTRRRRTSSRRSTPRPGRRPSTTRSACSAPSAGPARGARGRPGLPRPARCGEGRPRRLPRGRALVPAARPAPTRPRRIALLLARVRHHRRAAAVLRRPRHPGRRPPQGRQRPRRAARRRGAALPARATSSSRSPREGWQLETYPVLDPDELPITLLRDETASARRSRSPCPTARTCWPRSGSRRSAGCRCCCSTPTSRGTPTTTATSPTGSTAAPPSTACARRCCSASAACAPCALHARITGAPEPEVFHTNEGHAGFLGLERIRELTVEEGGPQLDFDDRARGLPGRRPSSPPTRRCPAGIDRFSRELIEQYFGTAGPVSRRRPRPDPGARRRGLRRRRPDGVQHGGHGLPALPARQRRLPAPRPRQPRDVPRPVAGLRRGRGADHRPSPTASTRRPGSAARSSTSPSDYGAERRRRRRRLVLGGGRPTPRRRASGRSSGSCAQRLVADARQRLRKSWPQARRRRAPSCSWVDEALDPDVLTIGFARRVAVVQAADADAARPRAAQAAAAPPGAPGAAGHRRQVPPRRRRRQEADPGARALRRRPRGAAPHRLPAQLRHRHGPAALSRLRRLAEQPAAPLRGVRHVAA